MTWIVSHELLGMNCVAEADRRSRTLVPAGPAPTMAICGPYMMFTADCAVSVVILGLGG